MSGYIHGNIITGFAGENRNLPAAGMPPNLSPDAENIDYAEGTIKKRKGFVRLTCQSVAIDAITGKLQSAGGVDWNALIGTAFSIGLYVEVHYTTPVVAWEYALVYSPDSPIQIQCQLGASGVIWRAIANTTDGVNPDEEITATLTVPIDAGTAHAVSVQVTANSLIIACGAEVVTEAFSAGYALKPLAAGAWALNNTVNYNTVVIDELAIGTFDYDDYTGEGSAAFAADSKTKALWRFNEQRAATTYYDVAATHSMVITSGTASKRRSVSAADNMVTTGLYTVNSDTIIVCTRWHVYKYTISTDTFVALTGLSGLYPPTQFYRWIFADIRDSVVMVNGNSDVGPKKIQRDFSGGNIAWDLTPPKPDASSTTGVAGAAGNPNGTYLYSFQYRNATDGSVGPRSTDTVTATVTNQKIELSDIPETTDPQVTKTRIYRTKAGGSTFYYVTEITNGVNTYSDNTADSSLVTEYDSYVGSPPTAPTQCVAHMNRLWLLQNRKLYYSEVATDSLPGAFASFYTNSYIDLEDDPEDGTGLASQGQTLLVTKLNSMWLIFPGWSVQKLTQGIGCVHGATFGYAPYGIYFLGLNGVYLLPFPLGSAAPIDITQDSQRALFEAMDIDYRSHSHGVYDPINRQYRVWFKTSTEYVMLVYTEANKSWAKHTIEVSAMVLDSYHDVPRVLGGYRGYIVELNRGYSDGLDVDGETEETPYGTITTPYDFGLADSAATFPTSGSGLANLNVTVVFSDGTTESKPILYNDATTLYLSEQWDTTPEAGDTYQIASYSGYWKSPRHPAIQPGDESIVEFIRLWKRGHGGSDTITATLTPDDDTALSLLPALTMADRFSELRANRRGREFVLNLSNGTSGQSFEIEAYQYLTAEATYR